jgi:hypothetical protein
MSKRKKGSGNDQAARPGSYRDSVIADLRAGKTVYNYKEGGNSMSPRIKNGQLQTLVPITDLASIKRRDILLCKVKGNIYTHQVLCIRKNGGELEFLIGNNHGGVNGWTRCVYGQSVEAYWERRIVER